MEKITPKGIAWLRVEQSRKRLQFFERHLEEMARERDRVRTELESALVDYHLSTAAPPVEEAQPDRSRELKRERDRRYRMRRRAEKLAGSGVVSPVKKTAKSRPGAGKKAKRLAIARLGALPAAKPASRRACR